MGQKTGNYTNNFRHKTSKQVDTWEAKTVNRM